MLLPGFTGFYRVFIWSYWVSQGFFFVKHDWEHETTGDLARWTFLILFFFKIFFWPFPFSLRRRQKKTNKTKTLFFFDFLFLFISIIRPSTKIKKNDPLGWFFLLLKCFDGFVGHRRRCFALVSFFFLVPNVFFLISHFLFLFTSYISIVFKRHDLHGQVSTPSIGFSKVIRPDPGLLLFFLNVLMFNSLTLTFFGFFFGFILFVFFCWN